MSKPFIHSKSHAKKFGGQPSDYIAINQFMDSSKAAIPDNRHRIFFHSSFGIFVVEKLFGQDMPKLKELATKHNLSEEAVADIVAYTNHVRTDAVTTITNSDNKEVSVRDIAEQHVLEDYNGRFIPSAQDFFNEMNIVDWMNNSANGEIPESAKQIYELRKKKGGFQMIKEIKGFFGKYRFLSNFYHSPIVLDDLVYPTVEHAYQAAKTLDITIRQIFTTLNTPKEAKKLGKNIILRPDWEKVKLDIMRDLVWQKFSDDSELIEKLLSTGDNYLEETNSWGDTFWGVCNGIGENRLGQILMEVRYKLNHKGL